MMVLVCLIFSVLSTIDRYMSFANQTLFWMVGTNTHTHTHARTHARTHAHTFNGPFSGTTQVSRYQKGKNQCGFY